MLVGFDWPPCGVDVTTTTLAYGIGMLISPRRIYAVLLLFRLAAPITMDFSSFDGQLMLQGQRFHLKGCLLAF